MRGRALFWCVLSFAWAWDAPAAYQPATRELAPDPYSSSFVLAPSPYPVTSDTRKAPAQVNRRSRRAQLLDARLAPSPYEAPSAWLAPMPYAGRLPERERARPSAQPLALAASPYARAATAELAPDPY
jgi:hypothetical protein